MKFWTFKVDDDVYDAECKTKVEALSAAEAGFIAECEEEGGWSNGDIETKEITLIEFSWNDEDGERVIHQSEPAIVSYEYYHGDAKEHSYP